MDYPFTLVKRSSKAKDARLLGGLVARFSDGPLKGRDYIVTRKWVGQKIQP